MRFVIVGGGIAGTTAAEELRRLEPESEVVLISQESEPLYSRVLLPPYIKNKISRERIFIKKEDWYQKNNIEWWPGERVIRIDAINRFVEFSTKREISYDRLLLAGGLEPRAITEDRRGVSYLRDLSDAENLIQLLKEKGTEAKAVVGGSGLIASEYINIFSHFNRPIRVIFRAPHFWAKNLTPAAGQLINNWLKEKGVEMLPNCEVRGLIGEQELTGVKTSAGDIPATIFGVGIGMTLDQTLLAAAGLEIGKGLRTDEFLQTNIPEIFAAGDVVEYFDLFADRPLMLGNWQKALNQGRVAARNMAGQHEAFKQVSSYATNLLGLDVNFIGDVELAAADRVVTRGSVEEGSMSLRLERDGRLVGGVTLNRNVERMPLTQEIEARQSNDK